MLFHFPAHTCGAEAIHPKLGMVGFQEILSGWILNLSGTTASEPSGANGVCSDLSSVPLPAPDLILPVSHRMGTAAPHSQGSSLHPTHLLQAEPHCRRVIQVIRVFLWLPCLDAQGVGSEFEEISSREWGSGLAVCPTLLSQSSAVGAL